MEDFLELAKENTDKDLETCGVLGAFLVSSNIHSPFNALKLNVSVWFECNLTSFQSQFHVLDFCSNPSFQSQLYVLAFCSNPLIVLTES